MAEWKVAGQDGSEAGVGIRVTMSSQSWPTRSAAPGTPARVRRPRLVYDFGVSQIKVIWARLDYEKAGSKNGMAMAFNGFISFLL